MPGASALIKRTPRRPLPSTARLGGRWVAFGDSITAGVNNARYTDLAQVLSLGQLTLVNNAGVAGDTTTQMLARFQASVAAYSPSVVTVLGGTNDSGQAVPLATTAANLTAIVNACLAIGAVPVLCTIPASNDNPAGRHKQNVIINAWIRSFAQARGLPLVDFYNLLVDPATGNYLTAYNYDGVHPNAAGFAAMGTLLSNTLAPTLPPGRSLLPQDAADPNNTVQNPLFIGQTSTPGAKADQWDPYGSGGTYTTDNSDTAVKGYWQTCSMSGGTNVGLSSRMASGFTPTVGHRYAMCGMVKSSGLTSLSVNLNTNQGVPVQPIASLAQAITPRGAFYIEWTATTGTTVLNLVAVGAGTGSFSLAQVGIYNLTTMGLT